jgi:hypothetical protein
MPNTPKRTKQITELHTLEAADLVLPVKRNKPYKNAYDLLMIERYGEDYKKEQ